MNAANEMAVAAFLRDEIGFLDIVRVVEEVCAALAGLPAAGLEDVLAADGAARRKAEACISSLRS